MKKKKSQRKPWSYMGKRKLVRVTSVVLLTCMLCNAVSYADTTIIFASDLKNKDKVDICLDDDSEIENDMVGSQDEIRLSQLYSKRLSYCNDYDKNRNEINKIDQIISKQGVEVVSETYVDTKLSQISKNSKAVSEGNIQNAIHCYIKKPSEGGVSWTSKRYIQTYRGKQYEIQELVAQPCRSNSSLDKTYSVSLINESSSKQAAKWTMLQNATGSVLGSVPEVGGAFSICQNIYSLANAYDSGLKATTVVDNVKATYVFHYVTEYTLCFVKSKGYSDASQILGYAGNYSSVATTTVIPRITYGKKHVIAKNISANKTGTISSPKYKSDKWDYACKYYYNYKRGISGSCHFNLRTQTIRLNNGVSKSFKIPTPNYGF